MQVVLLVFIYTLLKSCLNYSYEDVEYILAIEFQFIYIFATHTLTYILAAHLTFLCTDIVYRYSEFRPVSLRRLLPCTTNYIYFQIFSFSGSVINLNISWFISGLESNADVLLGSLLYF